MPARFSCRVAALSAIAGMTLLLASSGVVHAQGARNSDKYAARADQAQQVAKLIELPSGNQSLDTTLFPAVAAMTERPEVLVDWREDSLLTTDSADWKDAEKWAMEEPQRKALEALAKIGDTKVKYGVTLPYDGKDVDAAWVKAGLWVEPGPGGVLMDAQPHYIEGLSPLLSLVTIEATRLTNAGEGEKALRVLHDMLRLGRVIADRPMIDEKLAGVQMMLDAAERMRDVVYVKPGSFKSAQIITAIQDLDERLVQVMRIRLPEYSRLAADQIVEKTMTERGGVDQGKFAATLSRLTSSGRPLMRFSEAARWRAVGAAHAGWFDTKDEIAKVWGDYTTRWELPDLYDHMHDRPTDYSKMDTTRFTLVAAAMDGLEDMRAHRMGLLAEMSGTRASLAVAAYQIERNTQPPGLQAVVPTFARREYLEDPYSYDVRTRTFNQLEYFVPIRDQKFGPRELPHPHTVTVMMEGSDEMDEIQAFIEMLVPGYNSLGAIPVEAYDATSDKLDVERVKTYMKEAVRAQEVNPELHMVLAMIFSTIKDANVDPEMMRDQIEKSLGTDKGDVMIAVAQRVGLSVEDFKSLVTSSMVAWTTSPEFKVSVNAQSAPTDEQVRALEDAKIDWLTQPENVDKYLKKVIEAAKNAPAGASSGNSFDVQLDEKKFLVYSVGSDGKDQEARRVGMGGEDILYWPPILSLEREHLNSKP